MTEIPDTADELLDCIDGAWELREMRRKARSKRLRKVRCAICGEKIGPGSYISSLDGLVHLECERATQW